MSDSLSNSMSLSVSSLSGSVLSTPSLAAESYQRAAKLFLNKNFVQSLKVLDPLIANGPSLVESGQLSERGWILAWRLYFSLIDAASRSDDWPKDSQKRLLKLAADDSLWVQVQTDFAHYEPIPVGIVRGLIFLSARHCSDAGALAKISSYTELYLASVSNLVPSFSESERADYARVLDAYILKILPKRDEYSYAADLIDSTSYYSPPTKHDMKKKLQEVKESKERRAREAELEAKKKDEQKRKLAEQQQEEASRRELERQRRQVTAPLPTSSSPVRGSTPDNSLDRTGNSASRVSGFSSLTNYWKNRVIEFASQSVFWQTLLFIILIALTSSHRATRERVQRIINGLWRKLMETIRMGVKVSFV